MNIVTLPMTEIKPYKNNPRNNLPAVDAVAESIKQNGYRARTELHFTGRTAERLGYTYCECYPEPVKYWVAVHDSETQILDNSK